MCVWFVWLGCVYVVAVRLCGMCVVCVWCGVVCVCVFRFCVWLLCFFCPDFFVEVFQRFESFFEVLILVTPFPTHIITVTITLKNI